MNWKVAERLGYRILDTVLVKAYFVVGYIEIWM